MPEKGGQYGPNYPSAFTEMLQRMVNAALESEMLFANAFAKDGW